MELIVKMNNILIIIRRSNGDVFLSSPLKDTLQRLYPTVQIDYLVNEETVAIAKTISGIRKILSYDYAWKEKGIGMRTRREAGLLALIFGKYDLAINLTANDRGALYAMLAGKISVSAIDPVKKSTWWKKLFLSHTFDIDASRHILKHNMMPLKLLNMQNDRIEVRSAYGAAGLKELNMLPFDLDEPFVIFHPSAQYDYKIYPEDLRNELLVLLNCLGIPIVVTGGESDIDMRISKELPELDNIHNFIGKSSLQAYIALCSHARAYIGMDTLNMHIAASQNIQVFAIFGPTFPKIWSPWSNEAQKCAKNNQPLQHYGNITLFQADMPCVSCGLAGCDDRNGISECLYAIEAETIYQEVSKWLKRSVSQ